MDVISGRSSSTLNPNAPMFVPWAYRAVEDFSDQWWELVKSSAWFRDYWLQECFVEEPETFPDVIDIDDPLLPEIEAIFDDYSREEEEEEKGLRDMVSLGALKWRKPRFQSESTKYAEKAPKIVNVKMNPRPIQQPR